MKFLLKHFPDFDGSKMTVTPSRTGKYHSITAQLRFEELRTSTCGLCRL